MYEKSIIGGMIRLTQLTTEVSPLLIKQIINIFDKSL